MIRFAAPTLAAALAALALGAPAAQADDYMIHVVPPCAACITFPKPGLPDLLGQHPKLGAPGRRSEQQAQLRPSGPGAPNARTR